MIILSKLADYGVIIATQLAECAGQVNALHLAADTRLPPATVAKVLKLLAKAGIVSASRGAAGGYRLAQPPERISLADVVAAIDGDFAMTQCTAHIGPCERNHFCPTRPHWTLINQAVGDALSRVTLAEMRRPAPFSFIPPGAAAPVEARV